MSAKDTCERSAGLSRRRFLAGATVTAAAVALPAVGTTPAAAASVLSPSPGRFDALVPTSWLDLARTLIKTTPGYTGPLFPTRVYGRSTDLRMVADDGGHEGYLRNFPPGYVPPVGPGLWVPAPPGF